jgi:YD repeat-containing protein
MVPAERLTGVTVSEGDHLWVVAEDAFVEYRRLGPDELVAHKIITYTYDDVGRRVGWTVTWPQGPTQTQRLTFLYEGLVAVGERLDVGDVVTTTYYAWATRDRNTTVDAPALRVDAPITDVTRYDSRCQAAAEVDCVTLMARIIVAEASVGNEEEQRAVAWTFRNRLDRGLSLLSYAMDRAPSQEWYFDLAREVLTAPGEADVTKGATHFFSPRSMPLQGEEGRCKPNGIYDCEGGLVFVEGLPAPAYAPYWHLLYQWLPVQGIRKTHFLFYRIPPIRPRVGQ